MAKELHFELPPYLLLEREFRSARGIRFLIKVSLYIHELFVLIVGDIMTQMVLRIHVPLLPKGRGVM